MASAPIKSEKSVEILTYHGKKFVTGLWWHPLGSLNGYMREARQFGRQEKMDIVAIRHTQSIIQAGFVARSAGAIKGMYSLAASLAGQLGASWFAAWKLSTGEERYALVAVYEGAVIPGYDLVGTAEEIQRKVRQLLARSINFEQTFLPAEFDKDAKELDIDTLLSPANLRREYQLRPLAFGLSQNELMRLAAIGAVLVCALIGWQQWSAYQSKLAQEAAIAAEKKRLEELAALNLRAKQEQTIQALEHPWAKRPKAWDFVEGCNSAIDRLPLSIKGWPFSTAQCNGELVTATYKRSGNSTFDDFVLATHGHFLDEAVFNPTDDSASIRISLQLALAGDQELAEAPEAISHLTSWFHAQNLKPSITELKVEVPQPVAAATGAALPGQTLTSPTPAPAVTPDWKHFEFQYKSSLPPSIALRGVPETGLRLRDMKTNLQNDQLIWTVTGDLYAK